MIAPHLASCAQDADRLRIHTVRLSDAPLCLRPMTEADWDILYRWNNDPEALYFTEGDETTSWPLADMQAMYRNASLHAYVFVVELDGQPIGECWLQEMNLKRVLEAYPGKDVRRIDLMIGEKALWGQSWGTRIIALLTRFGFEECGADLIYNPDIGDYNPRSLRAFQKNGYRVVREWPQPPGSKAHVTYDLALWREEHQATRAHQPTSSSPQLNTHSKETPCAGTSYPDPTWPPWPNRPK